MKLLIPILFLITACGSADFLPKPKGYNRIDLPNHEYQTLVDTFPYSFEYSSHARVLKDSSWLAERYWIDLYYPAFKANVQITYKPINGNPKLIKEFLSDSYRLTSQHNVKAYAIEEKILALPNGDYASYTELEGEVPTPIQFHVSDSTNHFLRGAVYFRTATKNDSLAPVIDWLKIDVVQLLESLDWTQ